MQSWKKTLSGFLEFLVRPEYNLIYDFCTKKWRFPHEESISLFLLLGSWCVGSNFSCVESSTFYWENWSWQKLFFALLRDAKFGMIWYHIYHIIEQKLLLLKNLVQIPIKMLSFPEQKCLQNKAHMEWNSCCPKNIYFPKL